MTISSATGAAPNIFTALQKTSTAQASATVRDPDHDGDVDKAGQLDNDSRKVDIKA